MKKIIAMFLSIIMICSLVPCAFAAEAKEDNTTTTIGNSTQSDIGEIQPKGLYDYAWMIDSVTVSRYGFGAWRTGPSGYGPATLDINESTTLSRTFTNSISGDYSIGKATISAKLGVSIGVAETHGTSYTVTVEKGKRKTIICRPKTVTKKIVSSYYKIPTGIVGGKKEKIKSETCYVTYFNGWDDNWRYGY